mmetsp:Transcript_16328/g.28920  ORF Transcript_16328/g.28920 Transcript_16328/m.28920 type:complete len:271 (-) Transcript_16328:37-849(-)
MVCRNAAKTYLSSVNALVILLGVVVIAVGGYLVADFQETIENQFGDLAVYLPVLTGTVIVVVGSLGCFGARKQNKCVLLAYSAIVAVVTIIVLGVGIAFLVKVRLIDEVKLGESEALVGGGHQRISDSIFAVYETCCVDNGVGGSNLGLCSEADTNRPCVFDREFVESSAASEEFCTFLATVDVNVEGQDAMLVSEGLCLDPALFKKQFADFIQDNIRPIGIALVVLSIFLVLSNLFTCYLIFSYREEKYDENRLSASYLDPIQIFNSSR